MNASAPVSCLRPCDLRIDFTYLSVMALMRESRALIESSASFIARFIESTLCERRPMLVLQSDISPSRRLSWLRRCSVSRVLSWIFRLVSLFPLRCVVWLVLPRLRCEVLPGFVFFVWMSAVYWSLCFAFSQLSVWFFAAVFARRQARPFGRRTGRK